eukprot:TRINITY_DN39863_c0_g1_i1.p2 TRINITY_DN39863_c0_g1~~TRINITY_DN39863_c0_g1_i1.p2  ORF type:complete len:112 (-),score=0.05 TRINITY_DN39863_c0_g1_i1:3-338(-)
MRPVRPRRTAAGVTRMSEHCDGDSESNSHWERIFDNSFDGAGGRDCRWRPSGSGGAVIEVFTSFEHTSFMHWEGCSVERTTSDDGDSDTSDDAYTMAIIARMQSIGTFILN